MFFTSSSSYILLPPRGGAVSPCSLLWRKDFDHVFTVGAVLVIFGGWRSLKASPVGGEPFRHVLLQVDEDFDDVFTDWSCINFSALKRAFVYKTFLFEGEL